MSNVPSITPKSGQLSFFVTRTEMQAKTYILPVGTCASRFLQKAS